ncbi:hypothetical protein CN692_14135 [Bacillus sp. AFS002410]|uniref:hypothetical protein n=1 Tax=Bacillus sp. AFS002410 TaxID=2033481 RepID=UPI000BF23A61|nr:hypothetical protein [Bacillus sp. AFS002410]PEJ57286.1 hypothetical protein CN692_14135 [Bacillus sp. AFS002410]
MIKNIFKILAIISAISLLIYVGFTWNDSSKRSELYQQLLLMSMLIFSGIDNLLSIDIKKKLFGVLYFVVAFFITYVVFAKYV